MTKISLFGVTKDGRCIRLAEEEAAGKTIFHLPQVEGIVTIEARPSGLSECPPTEEKRFAARAKRTPNSRMRRFLRKAQNPSSIDSGAEKLNPDERVRRVAELNGAGMSQRAIARRLGVSERTVRRDLAEAEKHPQSANIHKGPSMLESKK